MMNSSDLRISEQPPARVTAIRGGAGDASSSATRRDRSVQMAPHPTGDASGWVAAAAKALQDLVRQARDTEMGTTP